MKKIFFIFMLLFLISGCGHHVVSYTKGAGVDMSWTPDSFTPSVRAGFYEFLFSMNRENAHIRYTTNIGMGIGDIFGIASLYSMITGKEASTGTGSGTVLEIKTGPMMNGYVDKILKTENFNENHANAIKHLTSVDNRLSDRETRITPFKSQSNATPVVTTEKGILGNSTVSTPVNEITKQAINKQVTPNSLIDLLQIWGLYIISGIIILVIIILIFIYFKFKKNNNENDEEDEQENEQE